MIDANGLAVIIAGLAGALGMPVYQAIKNLLHLEDNVALAGAAVFSLVVGAALSYLGGAFVGLSFSLPDIIQAASIVFAAATILYKAVVKGTKPPEVGEKPSDPDVK